MIRLEQAHTFPAPTAAVINAMVDPAYLKVLTDEIATLHDARLLSCTESEGIMEWTIQWWAMGMQFSQVSAANQTCRLDRAIQRIDFSFALQDQRVAKYFKISGTYVLRDNASGGSEWNLNVEVTVTPPFFVRPLVPLAERIIESRAREFLKTQADAMSRFVAKTM